jgi:hypothetical protein
MRLVALLGMGLWAMGMLLWSRLGEEYGRDACE